MKGNIRTVKENFKFVHHRAHFNTILSELMETTVYFLFGFIRIFLKVNHVTLFYINGFVFEAILKFKL